MFSSFGSHFGASCLVDSRASAFFCDLFFRASGGVSAWTDIDLPGAPLAAFLDFVDDVGSKFARNVEDSRAAYRYFVNKWHQPHLLKNKQGVKDKYS